MPRVFCRLSVFVVVSGLVTGLAAGRVLPGSKSVDRGFAGAAVDPEALVTVGLVLADLAKAFTKAF